MPEELFEKAVEAPAKALEKTIEASKTLTETVISQKHIKKVRGYWHNLGPGLTTGAADDDPSGIATYSQAGAGYGFQLIWLAGFTFPLMAVVQEMCARIGLVTGRGLAANIRYYFPRPLLIILALLLFITNTFNIGADLGVMAKAAQLLNTDLDFGLVLIGFTALSLGLQIFTPYEKYAHYLKWLALVLFSYVLSALSLDLDWARVLGASIIPSVSLNKDQIILICAILGTTISPYLFFWQTSQEVEEEILEGKTTLQERQETTPKDVKDMKVDVWSGMFISNLVMFFIIASAAAALNASGITNIKTAEEAALALRPIAGEDAFFLFAVGIIGTGMLAIPTLAGSASYALSETFGWRQGLYRKLKSAYAFYGVIMISMLVGLLINFIGFDSIQVLIYSAVLNGLVAPIILIPIVLISNKKEIMGKWTNSPLANVLGWSITLIMIVVGLISIGSFFI